MRANVTDRALRYRAVAVMPELRAEKRCNFCGSVDQIMVGHIDGKEENENPRNLSWTCRSCNAVMGHHFAKIGRGRRTAQYNPAGGATSMGQYMKAVMTLKGYDQGISLTDAIDMVHNTSHAKRSQYAREIWRLRKARGTDKPSEVPF